MGREKKPAVSVKTIEVGHVYVEMEGYDKEGTFCHAKAHIVEGVLDDITLGGRHLEWWVKRADRFTALLKYLRAIRKEIREEA